MDMSMAHAHAAVVAAQVQYVRHGHLAGEGDLEEGERDDEEVGEVARMSCYREGWSGNNVKSSCGGGGISTEVGKNPETQQKEVDKFGEKGMLFSGAPAIALTARNITPDPNNDFETGSSSGFGVNIADTEIGGGNNYRNRVLGRGGAGTASGSIGSTPTAATSTTAISLTTTMETFTMTTTEATTGVSTMTMPSLMNTLNTLTFLDQPRAENLLGLMDFDLDGDFDKGSCLDLNGIKPPLVSKNSRQSLHTPIYDLGRPASASDDEAKFQEKIQGGSEEVIDLEKSLALFGLDIDLDLSFANPPLLKTPTPTPTPTPRKHLESGSRSMSSLNNNSSSALLRMSGSGLNPIGEGEEDEFLERCVQEAREVSLDGGNTSHSRRDKGKGRQVELPPVRPRENRDSGMLDQEISLVDALREQPRRSLALIATDPGPEGEGNQRSWCSSPTRPLMILPRTSSMSATQLRSMSERDVSGSSPPPMPNVPIPRPSPVPVRRTPSISSEPSYSSSSVDSKVSRTSSHHGSSHFNRGSKTDSNAQGRLPNARGSIEGSLSSLRLSRAEEIAISVGIEKDEARAEEKKKASGTITKKPAGLMRAEEEGYPACEEVVLETATSSSVPVSSSGKTSSRGKMWGNMFAPGGSADHEKAESTEEADDVLDPVEVQAMGMLVPLREMHPSEAARNTNPHLLLDETGFIDTGDGGKDEIYPDETTKRKINHDEEGGRGAPERNSILFRLMGNKTPSPANQEGGNTRQGSPTTQQKSMKMHKSLGHKISATLLRCIGHRKSNTGQLPINSAAHESSANMPVDLAAATTNTSSSKRGKSSKKGIADRHSFVQGKGSGEFHVTGDAMLYHPLQDHLDAAASPKSRIMKGGKDKNRDSKRLSVVGIFLAMTNGKGKGRNGGVEAVNIDGASDFDPEGGTASEGGSASSVPQDFSWNGYSWESERFKDAGKNVSPGIGEGELVLEREGDFPEFCRGLRRTKKSYPSLRPGVKKVSGGSHPYLPSSRAANISWTNFLHEFAGSLGHVRESGIRPISDHRKGSSDSLALASRLARQSLTLGRSNLSLSSECLTALGMENRASTEESFLDDPDGILAHINFDSPTLGPQSSEGEKRAAVVTETEIRGGDFDAHALVEDVVAEEEEDEEDEEDDEEEDEEGGSSGYGSNGEGGSSADEDEDSKLRALLRQVGRSYVGYGEGKLGSSTMKKANNTANGGFKALRKPTSAVRTRPRVSTEAGKVGGLPNGMDNAPSGGSGPVMGMDIGDLNGGDIVPVSSVSNLVSTPSDTPPVSVVAGDVIDTTAATPNPPPDSTTVAKPNIRSSSAPRGSSGNPNPGGIIHKAGLENVIASYGLGGDAGAGRGRGGGASGLSKIPLPVRYRQHVQRDEGLKAGEGKEEVKKFLSMPTILTKEDRRRMKIENRAKCKALGKDGIGMGEGRFGWRNPGSDGSGGGGGSGYYMRGSEEARGRVESIGIRGGGAVIDWVEKENADAVLRHSKTLGMAGRGGNEWGGWRVPVN